MTDLRLGKTAPDPAKLAVDLAPHLSASALDAPPSKDWLSRVPRWAMYGNDRYGDCVWAMIGHAIKAWTTYAGTPISVRKADLLRGYHDVTGFTPKDPSTDQGTNLQDALNYWRTHGIAGHRIVAFAKVNHRDEGEIKAALNIFGALMVGIEFPRVAMDQFHARQPWTVANPDGGIEGGHAIHVGAYTPLDFGVTTWGRVQRMSAGFADDYVDEAWAVITPEWLTANGRTPDGLDLQTLGRDLRQLTGSNPF